MLLLPKVPFMCRLLMVFCYLTGCYNYRFMHTTIPIIWHVKLTVWIVVCLTLFSHLPRGSSATHFGSRRVYPFTLRVTLQSVVCYSHSFENNLWIERKFTKHLKKSSCLASEQHFSLKYFQENASVSKIFPKSSGLFRPIWVLMG